MWSAFVLHSTGTGKLASWGGVEFTERVDWFYELGLDGNSLTTDPVLVDRAGTDGILGFSSNPIEAPMILDDEDAGVTLGGTWTETTGNGGLNDDYWEANTGTGDNVATWTFSGLVPGGTYQVAATWKDILSGTASNSRYEEHRGEQEYEYVHFHDACARSRS